MGTTTAVRSALVLVVLCGVVMWMARVAAPRPAPVLRLELSARQVPANGLDIVRLLVRRSDGGRLGTVVVESAAPRRVRSESVEISGREALATLRAGVLPGSAELRVRAGDLPPASATVEAVPDEADSAGDGTPDFLRLEDAADRAAFRGWFTYLAEAQYFRAPRDLPAEITDCAALLRFAYREALRRHDGEWVRNLRLSPGEPLPPVRKYEYPHTALGAGLFRIRDGAYAAGDAAGGAFAEFADAHALRRFNTHLVSRDVGRARPGDLLFFRQPGQRMPDHVMIFTGRSRFRDDGADWIVYHTGPGRGSAGEIRRLTLPDLLAYPQAQWRPAQHNPAFLGVYRWNILRGAP